MSDDGRCWNELMGWYVFISGLWVVTIRKSSAEFLLLSLSDGSALCSLDPPSAIVPVTNFENYSPSLTSFHSIPCIPALAKCAYVCTQEENCMSYNYNETSDECELFFYTAINYASTDTCSHFKVYSLINISCSKS